MDVARAYQFLARAKLAGYDPGARTFRPWHRLARYSVEFQSGRGTPHLFGTKIVLNDPTVQCPHVVLHSFVHEAGHAQLLFLDIAVLGVLISAMAGAAWYWYVVAVLAWEFVWRELVADLFAVVVLGPRNTWIGYTHIDRRVRRNKGGGPR